MRFICGKEEEEALLDIALEAASILGEIVPEARCEKKLIVAFLGNNGTRSEGMYSDELNTIFITIPWDSDVEDFLKILAHEYYHKLHGRNERGAYAFAKRVVKEARRRGLL